MFHAVCDPVVPLKAMLGMPSFEASVAAPTVPDMRTVVPRFAAMENSQMRTMEGYFRHCLPPTLKPATAMSGAPPKYFGDRVWIP